MYLAKSLAERLYLFQVITGPEVKGKHANGGWWVLGEERCKASASLRALGAECVIRAIFPLSQADGSVVSHPNDG